MSKIKVLFVCMGNICRSPTAEGVFRAVVQEAGLEQHFYIDSAGTHSYHIGSAPDGRSQEAALKRGIDISGLSARRIHEKDFKKFDYILAMDADNHRHLLRDCEEGYASKVELMLHYANELKETEVPDPYYGGINGFEYVLDLVEASSRGLLAAIRAANNI